MGRDIPLESVSGAVPRTAGGETDESGVSCAGERKRGQNKTRHVLVKICCVNFPTLPPLLPSTFHPLQPCLPPPAFYPLLATLPSTYALPSASCLPPLPFTLLSPSTLLAAFLRALPPSHHLLPCPLPPATSLLLPCPFFGLPLGLLHFSVMCLPTFCGLTLPFGSPPLQGCAHGGSSPNV